MVWIPGTVCQITEVAATAGDAYIGSAVQDCGRHFVGFVLRAFDGFPLDLDALVAA